MLIVKKFGGTSVADKEKIKHVADLCVKEYEKGNQLVVVLSAMGNKTDELLAQAKDMNPKAPKRELDMLLTTGEQISVALLAMALSGLGVPAISFHAFQAGIRTTNHHGNASIKDIDIHSIRYQLDKKKIVIVTGFQGINDHGDYTTLGRGGSDTTAVALAAALSADACEIYTDVDGVYTADPSVIITARKLEEIKYDEMLELASLGAGVLHNRSVEVAKKYNVPLVVRSSLNNGYGTVIKDKTDIEKKVIKGVTTDTAAYIAIKAKLKGMDSLLIVFKHLAKRNICADVILFSENNADLKFLVARDNVLEVLEVIKMLEETLQYEELIVEDKVSKLSIVGIGVMSDPAIAPQLFETFYEENIPIKMISTSEIKITVVMDEIFTQRAIKAVHEKFMLSN
ncbi:MAG: aspartate kinase [Anaerocolumna sp.]